MKILFFLSHPAHFHLFKNVIKKINANGHNIIILIKSKDVLEQLVKSENWEYINTLKKERVYKGKYRTLIEAIFGLIRRQFELIKVVLRSKPDLLIGTEWAIVHIGKLFNIPSFIVNEDDTCATPENKFFYPFAKHLLLPACCDIGMWSKKRTTYNGYHELAYLHPNHFKANRQIVKRFNPKAESYSILRLVSLTASHDVGKCGITNDIARKIISILEKNGKIYITSEKKLFNDFEKYRIKINPSDLHHVLYHADLVIGDSQTMIAEAAVLGIPSIRFNDFVGQLGYLEELEHKYFLTYGIKTSEPEKLYQKIEELLYMPNLKEIWQNRRQKMLSEKIDVAEFMVWFIENYPNSAKIMKEDPDYQYRFRSTDYADYAD